MKTEKLLKILKFRADQQARFASLDSSDHTYTAIHSVVADVLEALIIDIEEELEKEQKERTSHTLKLRTEMGRTDY